MAFLAWLAALAILLGYEWYALSTGHKTLSRQMWEWSQGWPLLPWVVGVLTGGLAVHFFWPWCPK